MPPRPNLLKGTEHGVCKSAGMEEVNGTRVHPNFEEYSAETEVLLVDTDKRGFYQHLKNTSTAVGLEGGAARCQQFIRDEGGILLVRD